jgi:hypothetical protein
VGRVCRVVVEPRAVGVHEAASSMSEQRHLKCAVASLLHTTVFINTTTHRNSEPWETLHTIEVTLLPPDRLLSLTFFP